VSEVNEQAGKEKMSADNLLDQLRSMIYRKDARIRTLEHALERVPDFMNLIKVRQLAAELYEKDMKDNGPPGPQGPPLYTLGIRGPSRHQLKEQRKWEEAARDHLRRNPTKKNHDNITKTGA
jgi:hypothetical protein